MVEWCIGGSSRPRGDEGDDRMRLTSKGIVALLVIVSHLVTACVPSTPETHRSGVHGQDGGTFFDPDDTAALVEWASHVTIARLEERLRSSHRGKIKEVQYRATVIEALKGGLSGEITVTVLPASDATVEGHDDLDPLTVGRLYVLVSRPHPDRPWHTVEGEEAARLVKSPTHLAELKAQLLTALRS